MELFDAILLGLLQGLTEFLPVSSSGHLVLGRHLLNAESIDNIAFDVLLHGATLLVIIAYTRHEIIAAFKGDKTIVRFLIVGSLPAAAIGICFKDAIETRFQSLTTVGAAFMVCGLYIIYAEWWSRRKPQPQITQPTTLHALAIGIAQAIAIVPGISRSGSTVSTSFFCNIPRDRGLKLCFLLGIPAIGGAMVLKFRDIGALVSADAGAMSGGFIASAVSGYAALKILIRLVEKRRLGYFGAYLVVVGTISLVYGITG
jgi:undecaprenyl-diphosphatase